MGAFIVAGVVFTITVLLSLLMLFAAGMSDQPGAESGAGGVFVGGTILSALILATHWMPSIGW
jgi:hypothetical protein